MKNLTAVTRRRVAMACALGMSTLVTARAADAQPRWGRLHTPSSGACFYRDFDFRGDYFCARVGEDIPILSRGMDNQISSIQVFGDAEVTIFQDSRFRGRWTRLEGDVRNLRSEGWNDNLSSIAVDRDNRRRDSRREGPGLGRIENGEWRRTERRDDRRDDRSADRRDDRRDDRRISSDDADRIIRRAYQDILQRDPDTQGLSLYRSRMVDQGWSEAQVRDALLKSPEYKTKNSMSPQKAQEIVAAAYRSVLRREPDGGSSGYVERVLRDHWTQADVERELRNSAEYKSKQRR